jgi:hypothetical protein
MASNQLDRLSGQVCVGVLLAAKLGAQLRGEPERWLRLELFPGHCDLAPAQMLRLPTDRSVGRSN